MNRCLPFLLMALITLPAWGSRYRVESANNKRYAEMTLEELRREESRLRQLLIDSGVRLTGSLPSDGTPQDRYPTQEQSDGASHTRYPIQEQGTSDSPIPKEDGFPTLIQQETQGPPGSEKDRDDYRQFWPYMMREEVAKNEREARRNNNPNKGAYGQETHYSNGRSHQAQKESLKEYIIEMPLLSDRPKAERERIKVKLKPGVIPLLKKKHELNKLLVDDVVRMSGKSLK